MMPKCNQKKVIGIHELYANDPVAADKILWGREVDAHSRRGFLKKAGLAAMSAALGGFIPFASKLPSGLIPAAFADEPEGFMIKGKEGLKVLNDRPINAETPPHLLDDAFTPAKHFFVRNNGLPPDPEMIGDMTRWELEIAGESCVKPQKFTLAELQKRFKHYTYAVTLECGGNGRSEFNPPAKGNQWTTGAVGCSHWTGVRLRDVLEACGIKGSAVYIGYYGADSHLTRDPTKDAISRGVPMAKAMEDESLIAWGFNGEDIPHLNGFPLRLIIGGWPASTSGKWLNKIVIRNKVHDGQKMMGQAYRMPCESVSPGAKVADADMCIIHSMPVKSLITYPKSGVTHALENAFYFRGKAWAGDLLVNKIEVSIDFGATWQLASLEKPVNRLAWQKWSAQVKFKQRGYYEVWVRATDSQGKAQPTIIPGWNPKGYLNNACHRIAVQVA